MYNIDFKDVWKHQYTKTDLILSIAISHPLISDPSFTINCSLFPFAKGLLLPFTKAEYSIAKISPVSIFLPE
jgi:hypothetical protein